eukprot:7269431-Alexandrium_andersonii.AAC.1
MGHPECRCIDARGERHTQRDIPSADALTPEANTTPNGTSQVRVHGCPRRTPHTTGRPKCGCTDARGERHTQRDIPSADAL